MAIDGEDYEGAVAEALESAAAAFEAAKSQGMDAIVLARYHVAVAQVAATLALAEAVDDWRRMQK